MTNPGTLTDNERDAIARTLTATGGQPPSFSASGLPGGLRIDGNGNITGTIGTPLGWYAVTVTVSDGSTSATECFSWDIGDSLYLLDFTGLYNSDNNVVSQSLPAGDGAGPLTFSATGLPSGLTMASNGTISGTVVAPPGAYAVAITVSDSYTSVTQDFTWAIGDGLYLDNLGSLFNDEGQSVSKTVSAGDGYGPLAFSATGLPGGLTMTSDGTITGTVAAPLGSYNVAVTVSDSYTSVTQDFSWAIGDGLYLGNLGSLYNNEGDTVSTSVPTGGGSGPLTFTVSGLPGGLTMDSSGKITGTIATPLTTDFVIVTVADSYTSQTQEFTWQVGDNLWLSNPGSVSDHKGDSVSESISAGGGSGPYTWTASGLPAGLSMNSSGIVTGTVAGPARSYDVSVSVTDGYKSLTQFCTWNVAPNVGHRFISAIPIRVTSVQIVPSVPNWNRVINPGDRVNFNVQITGDASRQNETRHIVVYLTAVDFEPPHIASLISNLRFRVPDGAGVAGNWTINIPFSLRRAANGTINFDGNNVELRGFSMVARVFDERDEIIGRGEFPRVRTAN